MPSDSTPDQSGQEPETRFYPTFARWVEAEVSLGGFSGLARTLERELPQLSDEHVELLGSELLTLLNRVRAEQARRNS